MGWLTRLLGLDRQKAQSSADNHSVVVGRDVLNSTIAIGLDADDVARAHSRYQLETTIAETQAELEDLERRIRMPGDEPDNPGGRIFRSVIMLEWAATQARLGTFLGRMASSSAITPESTAQLDDSIAAFRAALHVWTPENHPDAWAQARLSLGAALTQRALGNMQKGASNQLFVKDTQDFMRLHEAVSAFDDAFNIDPSLRTQQWLHMLGLAHELLSHGPSKTDELEKAVAAYEESLGFPGRFKAATKDNLERCILNLEASRQRDGSRET